MSELTGFANFVADASSAAETACAHCGLPAPADARERYGEVPFCCQGCKTVYSIIRASGLENYYRIRAAAGAAPAAARASGRGFTEFDDAAFQTLYCRPCAGGQRSIELLLEGVHCAACVWLVERLPTVLPGVLEARLSLRSGLVRITWDGAQLPLSRIARLLDSLGYPPHPARGAAARAARRREHRGQLVRIAVAGACAGNVMLLAFALYGGMFAGMEAEFTRIFRWLSMLIAVVALAWPGAVFFRGAWAALRMRTINLDLPIAVGLGVGGAAGVVSTLRGVGEIYFDSLTMLVFLLLVGRAIQQAQQRRAGDAVELLFALTPAVARRESGQAATDVSNDSGPDAPLPITDAVPSVPHVEDVPVEALRPGDIVEVRAGESIPADGRIAGGRTLIDAALLTGESQPRPASAGDAVFAGTLNLTGVIRVETEKAGEETRVGKLMRLVEEGVARKAPIIQFADRVAGRLLTAALALSAATLVIWAPRDLNRAIETAVALLIVACPCALGLAAPLTIAAALGRAARRGIFIKGGDALELLSRPGRMLLDKTGTITNGRLSLVQWHGPRELALRVAALERCSNHPVAQAFCTAVPADGGCSPRVENVEQCPDGGIQGCVDGQAFLIGSSNFVLSRGAEIDSELDGQVAKVLSEALAPVLIAVDGRVRAVAGLGDALRPDARSAISALRSSGWQLGVLSGDHPQVVERVAREAGLDPSDCRGGVSPEEKLAAVRGCRASGPVVMVGDGVNDAAALAEAGVGIAVHGGAEASLSAADVYMNRPGLAALVELLDGARRTVAIIRRNFAISLAYNVIAVTFTMAGWINPLIAAVLMPLSSLTVLAVSLGGSSFGGRPCR